VDAWEGDYQRLGEFLNALGIVRGEEQEQNGSIVLESDFFIIPAVEEASSPGRLMHTEQYSIDQISNPAAYRLAKMEQSWGRRAAFALAVRRAEQGLKDDNSDELVAARKVLTSLLPHADDRLEGHIRPLLNLVDDRLQRLEAEE
jgi:hypothetical protein